MKKAKMMLSALAVIAVIGGAFAFKAKSTGFYVFTLSSDQQSCGLASGRYTVQAPNPVHFDLATTTTDPGAIIAPADCQNPIDVKLQEN